MSAPVVPRPVEAPLAQTQSAVPVGAPATAVTPTAAHAPPEATPVTALVPLGDFGPFDVLSDWAHQSYLDGRTDDAVRECREALALVEAVGDVRTARFLHYIAGTVLQETGRYAEAAVEADSLLASLDDSAGPYWRAKALALLAEARIGLGHIAAGMDNLAEGQALVTGPLTSYNHMSATQAVSLALRAVLLFEQADAMQMSLLTAADRPDVEVVFLHEACHTQVMWAALLELTGDAPAARVRYVECLSRLARMRCAAEKVGSHEMRGRVAAMEGLCLQRLGESGLAEARLREALDRWPLRRTTAEAQVAQVALGLAVAKRGAFAEARSLLVRAQQQTEQAHREVWHSYAVAALAAVETLEHGPHPAVDQWRRLSRASMRKLFEDRAGRFAALADRMRVRELAEVTDRMGRAVLEDPLTGLGNRRLLQQHLGRDERRLAVVFLDVDRFKHVNDDLGHDVGDEVLRRVARLLVEHTRADDVLVRYGGDEFIVLLPGDDSDAALVAERVHAAVRHEDWSRVHPKLTVTASIGVSGVRPTAQALRDADVALYQAKRSGRDRVAVSSAS